MDELRLIVDVAEGEAEEIKDLFDDIQMFFGLSDKVQ